ncbi:MAG TPA: cytochrome c peroxidase [Chitinophagaceae bacterium]|nr:cytochrome c peroxidase [Chitinophagaceae bacterium]
MKKKLQIILFIAGSILLVSFLTRPAATPEEAIKAQYQQGLLHLLQETKGLQLAIEKDEPQKNIQARFFSARMAYKEVEVWLAYYFELDVNKLNGLPTNFIEEEDPTAYQQPQGFQVIESFLYPQYNQKDKANLLHTLTVMITVLEGLSDNLGIFNPENYAVDAAMESLYRVITLGITGFDSPLAQYSMPEAASSLRSVSFVLSIYKPALSAAGTTNYNQMNALLANAEAYLLQHQDFAPFNRAFFISEYINPLCALLGKARLKAGFAENPTHHSLISRTGSLFDAKSLRAAIYSYDDTTSDARVQLGRKIFFEPLLSANGKRSCASCHQPARAFTDGLPRALQMDEHSQLPRNTPGLWNAALQMNFFYDSRQHRLDDVVLEVLSNEREMNNAANNAVSRLQQTPGYKSLYKKAYPGAGDSISSKLIANAVTLYLRTLVSYNARFDKYMRGQKDQLSTQELQGFNLFAGKAKCATCHYLPLFNGSKPPGFYYQESEVIGVPANANLQKPVLDTDPGRISSLPQDFMDHAFKTPTLRNIALTAPYMHNGVFSTLTEVINFYDQGGGQGIGLHVPNQTLPAEKLQLTPKEKQALEAFLHTLTDTTALRKL